MDNTKEAQAERIRHWRELVSEQKQTGQPVRTFCKDKNVSEPSFYYWRQRFRRTDKPVRFALVETAHVEHSRRDEPLELVLASGDRVRIRPATDAGMLRMVLAILREPRR